MAGRLIHAGSYIRLQHQTARLELHTPTEKSIIILTCPYSEYQTDII